MPPCMRCRCRCWSGATPHRSAGRGQRAGGGGGAACCRAGASPRETQNSHIAYFRNWYAENCPQPPAGCVYTLRSLRSGFAFGAISIGVQSGRVNYVGGWVPGSPIIGSLLCGLHLWLWLRQMVLRPSAPTEYDFVGGIFDAALVEYGPKSPKSPLFAPAALRGTRFGLESARRGT